MKSYLFRHLTSLFITLFLVSFIIFLIFLVIPGDPVALFTSTSATPEQIAILRQKLHLDQSLFQQYTGWMKGALNGDLGISIQYSIPVKNLLGDRIIVTSTLALMSIILIIIVSLPLGFYAAKKDESILDKIINNSVVIGLSIPNYFLGILMIWILGIQIRLFVPGEFVSYKESAIKFLQCLLFPAIAIAIPNICMMTKFVRASTLGQMQQDYIRTAKSKGCSESRILFSHILKNALIPVLTMLGMIIAEVLSGSIIVEQVFSIPGLGRLLIGGINRRDFPVVITLVVYISLLVVVINSIVDFIVRINDPRIRVE